jgi:hypothetical protein
MAHTAPSIDLNRHAGVFFSPLNALLWYRGGYRKIIKEWNTIGKIYASVERIGELSGRKPAVQDAPGAVEARPLKGHVH